MATTAYAGSGRATAVLPEPQPFLAASEPGVSRWYWSPGRQSLWSSDECRRLCGLATAPLTLTTLHRLIPAADRTRMVRSARQALTAQGDYTCLFRLQRPDDGTLRWLSAQGRSGIDEAGPCLSGTLQEVTGLQQQIAALEAERDRAHAANLAKSVFLATMSHELRTPLNAIIGFSDLLRTSEPNARRRDNLEIIFHTGQHLLTLLQNILDLSLVEAGKLCAHPVDFALDAELEAVARLFRPEAERKGLIFSVSLGRSVPRQLQADPNLLRQVLINLIGNALKFTDRGRIELRVERADRQSAEGWDELMFHVTDTGRGIKPESRERIFEMFEQEDSVLGRRLGGSGLGLAICKRLVALLGGQLWLESAPGVGSRFSFTARFAPVGAASPALATPPATRSPRGHHDNQRLLLVDDDPFSQALLLQVLGESGYRVTSATDGDSALALLEQEPFALVLMDVRLPALSGLAATRRIRDGEVPGCDPAIPVIAITSYAMRGDRDRFLSQGMSAYISKPIDLTTLLATIEQLLD